MRSVSQRKGRVAIASLSVTLAIAVVSGMLGITSGIEEKLGAELKAYGANIMVSPAEGGLLDLRMKDQVVSVGDVESAGGQYLARAELASGTVEIIGLDIPELRNRGWKLEGNWPGQQGEVIAGVNLRDALKIREGARVNLRVGGRTAELTVKGFVERGGTEDNAFIMSLSDAWQLTGDHDKLSVLLLRGRAGRLEGIVNEIRGSFPNVTVRTLRQVAQAEASLLAKIQFLMILVTIVVLLAAVISVGSTMGATVIERREELGLMKAIGATAGDIRLFYSAESVLIGAIGGCAGFVLGAASAVAVSKGAFGSSISLPFYMPFVSLASGIAIAVVSGYLPVRDALKYNPAEILRGE